MMFRNFLRNTALFALVIIFLSCFACVIKNGAYTDGEIKPQQAGHRDVGQGDGYLVPFSKADLEPSIGNGDSNLAPFSKADLEPSIGNGDSNLVPFSKADSEPAGQVSGGQELKAPNMKSGPIAHVPWEENNEFLTFQGKAGTPVMMAAYRTVLRDPLPGEEENVHLAARMLAGKVIRPGEIFSQNGGIGPYTESRGFKIGPTYSGPNLIKTIGGGVCKIASTLYNVTVFSNLEVVERYCHSMPVPYVPYGQDATVSYGNKDFKFRNNTASPVLIWAEGIDNELYIAFYGVQSPPGVEWHHETLEIIKAGAVYKPNPNLPGGEEKLLLEGMDGGVVRSWVTIKNPDGTVTEKQLGKSYYNPMPYIYEVGKR